jgi:hypothetical protein
LITYKIAMKLRIGEGTPHVRISTQGPLTRLSFGRKVSLRLLSIDPLQDTCCLGGIEDAIGDVNFFTIHGELYGVELCTSDLNVEISGINLSWVNFTVESNGLRNAVVIRDNDFESLTLVDNVGQTKFDLSHQLGLTLHTKTRNNSVLLFARTAGPTCVVCADNEATEVYMPCGHWGICKECSMRNECTRCPVCRGESQQMMSLYVA